MAIRVHVVGARDTTEAELVAALEGVAIEATGEEGTWAWARTPVRRARAKTLDRALEALGRPGLRVTTVDGALWRLRLSAPARTPFEAEHWHILREEGRPAREAAEGVSVGEFAAERAVPASLLDDRDAPLDEAALDELLARHARWLADAVAAFGLVEDPDAVREVLTGDATTEHELGWDVGDLPRFLACLGLEGPFEGWRDELAEEEEAAAAEARALAELAEAPLSAVRAALEGHTPAPVDGGPVRLPLDELVLVRGLADQCATGFAVGVSVEAAGNEAVAEALAGAPNVVSGARDGRIEALLDNWARLTEAVRAAGAALSLARDGAAVEVMTARVYGDGPPGAEQWFRGRLVEGVFEIDEATPHVDAATLGDALQLMREWWAEGGVTALDEAEIAAVRDEMPEEIWFVQGPPELQVDGRTLRVREWYDLENLVQFLFIRRFGDVWDVRARAAFHRDQLRRG